ncbi:protoporphyrinogen oxidase [Planctomycetes bacterium Pan216]|uniref:Protoporphyrinogen oxidase n=1 Tax=Kolteria novifilia TaxID=2527975 RepID=A0A518B1C4_9BACT|nr:protoporphyrinogen oxidase [Planctomycetes bacterium Pan216]
MKIAILGTGISGLFCAYLLQRHHDLAVYEANEYVGGHAHTVDVSLDDKPFAVDTGFIVFNPATYPNFIKLLDRLGVPSRETSMSFSVRCDPTGLEYGSDSLNALFAQRRNLVRPRFLGLIQEILRFNQAGRTFLAHGDEKTTLGSFLEIGRFSQSLLEHYILPMGAAIWSTDPKRLSEFPARCFLRFFENHGLLHAFGHPIWRTVEGGSRTYVRAISAGFTDRIRTKTPIERVIRHEDHVEITPRDGESERFDQVIIATHADQALRLLADASETERQLLRAFPYQANDVVLHTDRRLLPRSQRAWSSWNYRASGEHSQRVAVTYNLSMLQHHQTSEPFCVTLNQTDQIDSDKILRRMTYHHPTYGLDSFDAQRRYNEIGGRRRTHFCGAYWGYGFHEDGVKSALRVAQALGATW